MGKHDNKLRGHGGRRSVSFFFTLFRMLLSLIIVAVLFLALYQAFKNFSGLDPLKLSPESVAKELTSSETIVNLISQLLTFDFGNPEINRQLQRVAPGITSTPEPAKGNFKFRFAIVADSHNDNLNLEKALKIAKEKDAKFVIGLGDYTDVGLLEDLQMAKRVFEKSGLAYYSTAGDHDLWDSRDKGEIPSNNFNKTFGSTYNSFGYEDIRFLIVYNSDNYQGIDQVQKAWIEEELQRVAPTSKLTFVFAHTPFYHPSSDRVYGKTEPDLKVEAQSLIDLFKKYHVAEIFAGDTHYYSNYTEPNSALKMTTIGAVTSARNPQAPRFAVVDIYDSGQYTIQDTEIK